MQKVEDAQRNRQLMLIGKYFRMKCAKYPRIFLTASCTGKRNRGRPFRAIMDSFADSLKLLIKDVDPRGDLKDWTGCVQNKNLQKKIAKERTQSNRRDLNEEEDWSDENPESDDPRNNTNRNKTNALMKNESSRHDGNMFNVSNNRDAIAQLNTSKIQARRVFGCEESEDAKEVRRKYGNLASKYYSGKWFEQCNFSRSEGKCVFK